MLEQYFGFLHYCISVLKSQHERFGVLLFRVEPNLGCNASIPISSVDINPPSLKFSEVAISIPFSFNTSWRFWPSLGTK